LWYAEHDNNTLMSFSAMNGATAYTLPGGLGVQALGAATGASRLWFAASASTLIGNSLLTGVVTTFGAGTSSLGSLDVAFDLVGTGWFTTASNGIGSFTVAGLKRFWPIKVNAALPSALAIGGDGAMWYMLKSGNKVGRITGTGAVTEYSLGFTGSSGSYGIVAGPDGRIWFADTAHKRIGQINLDGSGLKYFSAGLSGSPLGMVLAPDNRVYFGESEGRIGSIAADGTIVEYPLPGVAGTTQFPVRGVAVGPDGNVWFVNDVHAQIGRLQIADKTADCIHHVWNTLALCGWPGPGNSGYPKTLSLRNTAGRTITADNTVVDGERITGGLVIAARNVTVRNSLVINSAGGASGTGVISVQPGATALIEDTTLDGSNATHAGIWYSGASLTARGNEIYRVNDGIFSWDADNFILEDNYLHDFTTLAANGHIDGFQTEGASHGVIRHNVFDVTQSQNADVAIWNSRRNSDDILIENNLMAGGGFAVYAEDYSPSESDPIGGYAVTNIRFLNNKFSTVHYPCAGYWGVWYPRGAPTDQWLRRGNVVLETMQNIDTRNPTVGGVTCN
jgi:streptogramin lyase